MSGLSAKTRDRLLYLISPIGLLLLWELLLRAGFGDRRFIPAPSDIATRYWQLVVNGELAYHTGVTLMRVFAGFFIGVIPAIALGLLMAMFTPVRIFIDPLIASLFPIPKIALMPLLAAGVRLRRRVEDRAGRDRGVLPGDREHLCRRRQYREDLLGRREELRRQPDRAVHPHRVLRRAADDLRGAAHRAGGVVHRAGGGRVRRHQERLGYLIWNSWELLEVTTMFCGIVTIGILGLITSALFQELERKVIPWKAE